MHSNWKKIDIIFVRHAESNNNSIYDIVKDKYKNIFLTTKEYELEVEKLRDPDCECSARGLKQCEKLYEHIKTKGNQAYNIGDFDINDWKLYSSPMKRCLITSKYISDAYDHKPVSVIPFLYESDGCYSTSHDGLTTIGYPGMTSKEVHQQYLYHQCEEGMENGWYTLPHKEPKAHFLHRSSQVADWLWKLQSQSVQQRGFKTGAILTVHGNLIGAIISALMKTSMLVTHHNTGYTHIELWSNSSHTNNCSCSNDNNSSTSNNSRRENLQEQRIPCIQFINRIQHLTDHIITTINTNNDDDDTNKLICGADTFHDHWIQEFDESIL